MAHLADQLTALPMSLQAIAGVLALSFIFYYFTGD